MEQILRECSYCGSSLSEDQFDCPVCQALKKIRYDEIIDLPESLISDTEIELILLSETTTGWWKWR